MGKKRLQKEDHQQQKESCIICLTRHTNATLNCDHKFCYRCILKWANKKQTCPTCRRQIRLIATRSRKVQYSPRPPTRARVPQRIINNLPRIPPLLLMSYMLPMWIQFGMYSVPPMLYPIFVFPAISSQN